MELLRTGKVKEVYDAGNAELLFHFTNNISVFDKIIPTQVPRKGEALARTSAFWFEKVAGEGLCKTHFLELTKPDEMRVRRVEVISDYDKLDAETTNYLIPLEVICRHYVAGSLYDAVQNGRVDPETIGFSKGNMPKLGERLPEPLVEFTTKLEPVDRKITEAQALEISGLTEDELETVRSTVLRIDELIERHVEPRGLIHADGKKEFAFDADRELMIIDTFGTSDEDRWWERDVYEDEGRLIELSKEFVRQHYRHSGYHAELEKAREAGVDEPDIPALSDDVVAETTALYGTLFERITGEAF